jgi:hypothetical protein
MQILIIKDEHEEDFGIVTPLSIVNFPDFDNAVRKTWSKFNEGGLNEYASIEDFVEFHNECSDLQIDNVVSNFIQL